MLLHYFVLYIKAVFVYVGFMLLGGKKEKKEESHFLRRCADLTVL